MSSAWGRRLQPGVGRIRTAWSDSTPRMSRMTLVGSMLRREVFSTELCLADSPLLFTVRPCVQRLGCADPSALLLPNLPHDQIDEVGHEYVGKQDEECEIHDVLPFFPFMAAWLLSISFTSPMTETLCKGWTIHDGMSLPSKQESITRLAWEPRAMIRSEVCCCADELCVKEPKIIQAESLSIQWQRH